MQLHQPGGWLSPLAPRAVDPNDNGSGLKSGIGNLAAGVCRWHDTVTDEAGRDAPANTPWNFQ